VSLAGSVDLGDHAFLERFIADQFSFPKPNTPEGIARFVSDLPFSGQEFKHPTVSEIALHGGNCDDKAILALYLLRRRGFPARFIVEGTYVVDEENGTGYFAERFLEDLPFVGKHVNSHAYVQAYDPESNSAVLVDPTAGFAGALEFCERRILGTKPFFFPSFPFLIFACGRYGMSRGETENVTTSVLVDLVAELYPRIWSRAPSPWREWCEAAGHFQKIPDPWGANEKALSSAGTQAFFESMLRCISSFRNVLKEDAESRR